MPTNFPSRHLSKCDHLEMEHSNVNSVFNQQSPRSESILRASSMDGTRRRQRCRVAMTVCGGSRCKCPRANSNTNSSRMAINGSRIRATIKSSVMAKGETTAWFDLAHKQILVQCERCVAMERSKEAEFSTIQRVHHSYSDFRMGNCSCVFAPCEMMLRMSNSYLRMGDMTG